MIARTKNSYRVSGCAREIATARLLLPFVVSMFLSGVFLPTQAHQAQQKSSTARKNTPSRDLHKIGEAIAKAVLDKNIETLLTFDRADLRSQDEESLKKDRKST